MHSSTLGTLAGLVASAMLAVPGFAAGQTAQDSTLIRLPAPATDGGAPLTRALAHRRSVRSFAPTHLQLSDVAQLLWAAQGVTRPMPEPAGWRWGEWRGGLRTAPSAGALYPLELYLLATAVDGLDGGLYRYVPVNHALVRVGEADASVLAGAALGQRAITAAPAVVIVAAVEARTAIKYGERAPRYVDIEVGAAAENLLLQAQALGLGGVFMGAFRDAAVQETMGLPADHAPLGLVVVGHPAGI
jgi:SagB-type dehydrogenase family enzyme